MKLKALFAGVVLALGANAANAAIATGETSSGELFLSVWDKTAQVSYSQDLNIDLFQFLTNTSAGGFNSNASWSVALNPAWAGFYNPANAANTVYNVAAADLDNGKLNAVDQTYGYLSSFNTSNPAPVPANNVAAVSTPAKEIVAKAIVYNANLADAEQYSSGPSYYPNAWGSDFNTKVPVNQSNDAAIDQVLAAVFHGLSSTLGTDPDTGDLFVQDRFDILPGKFQLTATELKYTVAPATVPVPGAVWLLGSALAGFVSIARRGKRA
ncbi:VPLPA-CTERM sorting domain-containing protein [Methylococcus sp. EFPC2]|uniref:VPLPA-CTERM sorting domain-containing protein n=1 Tax=Methylococcus sp. EFPC2 TaxID=2812648 RepID=UPI00196717F0|nr:VPLPA-CTERM sorting domain-containing protein [Methylococcus sp. EFPC2]QSA97267.1 VPLPA-CTERM sorting domain-containing protein [Methylococcus sp. EFPC2]